MTSNSSTHLWYMKKTCYIFKIIKNIILRFVLFSLPVGFLLLLGVGGDVCSHLVLDTLLMHLEYSHHALQVVEARLLSRTLISVTSNLLENIHFIIQNANTHFEGMYNAMQDILLCRKYR